MSERRVSVAGLGNLLMGDDALGPRAVREFAACYELPAGVSADDLGTPGLDLYPYLAGLEGVILIDTIRVDGPPGEIRLYREEELMRHPPAPRSGPHDPGLKETLGAMRFAGTAPGSILLVGVIPERVEPAAGLSGPVERSLPGVMAAVADELQRLGRPAVRRSRPRRPDRWWEDRRPGSSRPPED